MHDLEDREDWHERVLKPRLGLRTNPVRPADVAEGLCKAMLAREHILEDVHYRKIVPNRYVVEVEGKNYERNYKPIEGIICSQWREKLFDYLTTTNSRQGRREYQFGGRVTVSMRPVVDLKQGWVRILCRIEPGSESIDQDTLVPAYLEILSGDKQWNLQEGVNTIGRDAMCDIALDMDVVQEKRMVSGQHAYLRCEGETCVLYDGAPGGKASVNGTYVNQKRLSADGQLLEDGDQIILAALDPRNPRLDTPGVVALRFRLKSA